MKEKILKIGVIGYSSKSFPIYKAAQLLTDALETAIMKNRLCTTCDDSNRWSQELYDSRKPRSLLSYISFPKIEIVSGYTDYGIPALCYSVADLLFSSRQYDGLQYTKVGFAPKCSLIDRLCKVDKEIIVGENYGDESTKFIDYIDVLIQIGGGKQSIQEAKMFKALKPNNLYIGRKLESY